MGSKVGVEQWWGKEGETTEVAWQRMMDMDTSQISDPLRGQGVRRGRLPHIV